MAKNGLQSCGILKLFCKDSLLKVRESKKYFDHRVIINNLLPLGSVLYRSVKRLDNSLLSVLHVSSQQPRPLGQDVARQTSLQSGQTRSTISKRNARDLVQFRTVCKN